MINKKLSNGIIVVVTAVWAINFIAGIVLPTYEPDQAINAIFMGIVGGLFAISARQKNSDDDTNNKDKDGNGGGGAASG